MGPHWNNVYSVIVAGGLVALSGSARAADIDADDASSSCHLTGSLSVHDDETNYSVIVSDLTGEGDDCYARLVILRDGRSDAEVRSFKTDGENDTVSFHGTRVRAQTTGATLYACVDHGLEGDDCTEVYHVEEN